MNPRFPVNQQVIEQESVLQSATYDSPSFKTVVGKLVSVVFTKSGTGKGNAKIQGSNDDTNWVDFPDAESASAVTAGADSVVLFSQVNPFLFVKLTLTEDGTGPLVVESGMWASK